MKRSYLSYQKYIVSFKVVNFQFSVQLWFVLFDMSNLYAKHQPLQIQFPYQNIGEAVKSKSACVFKIGFQYTRFNGKEKILSEKKKKKKKGKNHVFITKSQFSGIFENSILYLKYTAVQILNILFSSVKCIISENECQK